MSHPLTKRLVADSQVKDATLLHPVIADQLESTPEWVGFAATYGFTAKAGETLLITDSSGHLTAGLVGVDRLSNLEVDPWWLAPLASALPDGQYALAPSDTLSADARTMGALGFALAGYRFDRYKSTPPTTGAQIAVPEGALAALQHKVAAVALVRDLVNTPAEDMGPATLESVAEQLAAEHGAELTVIRGDRLLDAVFPAIHAVGRAATPERAPRLIELNWAADGTPDTAPKISLVGKGVCFDTGGLNLKQAASMRWMKKDMGGAAHVLGLAQLIMQSRLPVRLQVLVPAVENAVSGGAFRPGDVLSTRAGISIEVGNTDAEGRLILCDALTYATEGAPDLLLDFATLTGAARVALGPDLAPVYTDDEALWSALAAGAKASGDPVWRMPLYEPYTAMLESPIADTNNIGGDGQAGSITAALFLQRFVGDHRWAHFDIYAWRPSGRPGQPEGGTAHGLLASFEAIKTLI